MIKSQHGDSPIWPNYIIITFLLRGTRAIITGIQTSIFVIV